MGEMTHQGQIRFSCVVEGTSVRDRILLCGDKARQGKTESCYVMVSHIRERPDPAMW